jgi:tetratricopeptide (TPR) repeat protein
LRALILFLLPAATAFAAPMLALPDGLLRSSDMAAILAAATLAEDQGSYDLAADALRRAVEVRPEEAGPAARLIENLYRTGAAGKDEALSRADALLQGGAASKEISARVLLVRGLIQLERGNAAAAAQDFDAVLAADSANARAGLGLAAADAAQGNLVAASQRIDTIGKAGQPYDVETRYLMRWALQGFQQSGQPLPNTAEAHSAHGKLLYRAGRLPEAGVELKQAATLAATDPAAWNLVAAVYGQLGNREEIKAACQASLALNPQQPEITKLLESVTK